MGDLLAQRTGKQEGVFMLLIGRTWLQGPVAGHGRVVTPARGTAPGSPVARALDLEPGLDSRLADCVLEEALNKLRSPAPVPDCACGRTGPAPRGCRGLRGSRPLPPADCQGPGRNCLV